MRGGTPNSLNNRRGYDLPSTSKLVPVQKQLFSISFKFARSSSVLSLFYNFYIVYEKSLENFQSYSN